MPHGVSDVWLIPVMLQLPVRWLCVSLAPLGPLLGTHCVAAFMQFELFWVYTSILFILTAGFRDAQRYS